MTTICGRCGYTPHPRTLLSDRERDVLHLMAEGRSNIGIAKTLWITEGTVEKHVRAILTKLDIPGGPDDHRRVLAVLTELSDRHDHEPDTIGLDQIGGRQMEGSKG